MTLQQLSPFIIPGILIQVGLQAYFIKHCWEHPRLLPKQKALYLIAILLLNIPAAAFYLLRTRSNQEPKAKLPADLSLDRQTQLGIHVLLILAFEVFALRLLFDNLAQPHYGVLSMLIGLSLTLHIVIGLLPVSTAKPLRHILAVALLLSVSLLFYLGPTLDAQLIVLTTVAGLINGFPLHVARWQTAFIFSTYMGVKAAASYQEYGAFYHDEFISNLYFDALFFSLVFAAFYSLKKQMLLNLKLQASMRRQQEQAAELEKLAMLRERQRIVGTIHDTVGHTLTTALIALEAGEQIWPDDPSVACEKMKLAEKQVRQGLHDLRQSVRTIKTGQTKPFPDILNELFQEIRAATDLTIEAIVNLESPLLPIQQNLLTQVIRESVTNSLKHGQSKHIDLLLQEHRDQIQLTLSDDGGGTDDLQFGFGLSTLQERVISLGGKLQAESQAGEGFTLQVTLPLGQEQGKELA